MTVFPLLGKLRMTHGFLGAFRSEKVAVLGYPGLPFGEKLRVNSLSRRAHGSAFDSAQAPLLITKALFENAVAERSRSHHYKLFQITLMRRIGWRNIFPELGASAVSIGFSHVFNFFGFDSSGGSAVHFAGASPIVFFGARE